MRELPLHFDLILHVHVIFCFSQSQLSSEFLGDE
jgi:hypothetical protein